MCCCWDVALAAAAPTKYFEPSRNASAAEAQSPQTSRYATHAESQKLHQSKDAAPPEAQNAARELTSRNYKNPDASTRIERKQASATGVLQTHNYHSASAAAQRPSSPAAESEESAANGAVGGRVQRLVVLMFGQFEYSFFVMHGGWLVIDKLEEVFFRVYDHKLVSEFCSVSWATFRFF